MALEWFFLRHWIEWIQSKLIRDVLDFRSIFIEMASLGLLFFIVFLGRVSRYLLMNVLILGLTKNY